MSSATRDKIIIAVFFFLLACAIVGGVVLFYFGYYTLGFFLIAIAIAVIMAG